MTDLRELALAAQDFAGMLARNADMLDSTMQSLGCSEAEALADIVRLAGFEQEAEMLLDVHAETDDIDDMHHERNAA